MLESLGVDRPFGANRMGFDFGEELLTPVESTVKKVGLPIALRQVDAISVDVHRCHIDLVRHGDCPAYRERSALARKCRSWAVRCSAQPGC